MRTIFLVTICLISIIQLQAQKPKRTAFTLKGGLNFSNISNIDAVNGDNESGFMLGAAINKVKKGIIGYKSELIFSRQGYDFSTGTSTGTVQMDYLILPQLMTINVTRFVQFQLGGQLLFLLNAKSDSVSSRPNISTLGSTASYFNKLNYGFAGGVEIKPIGGFFLGARANFYLAPMNKSSDSSWPPFFPKDGSSLKQNLLQLYAGYTF